MDQTEHLVEQHIREYEARLKHIDELLQRAQQQPPRPQPPAEIAEIQTRREELADHIQQLKIDRGKNWQREEILKAGPMGVWDAVAQQLEKLLERLER